MRTIWGLLVAMVLMADFILSQRVDSSAMSAPVSMMQRHSKTARAIRGFKNLALSTARGFGKRTAPWQDQRDDPPVTNSEQRQLLAQGSMQLSWLADQMQSNPGLARLILRRFVDLDHDDRLSPEELLRNE